MPYCPKCGKEVNSGIVFCPRCGAILGALGGPSKTRIHEKGVRDRDMLGVMSAGVILIILSITYLRYPIGSAVFIDYVQSMADRGAFIKPPIPLLNFAVFFLYAAGIWGIVLSGLRILFQGRVRKALGDLSGGFFSFFCAHLLTSYTTDILTEQTILGYFLIAIGTIVILNTILYFIFPEK